MPSQPDFWWNWGVQAAIAVGTNAAVLVALFGGWLRARLTPPKLVLSLTSGNGSKSPLTLRSPDGSERDVESRWYHVRVENSRRWSPATQVQVFLLRIEEPDAGGVLRSTWIGDLPLRWRLQEVFPLVRNIGHAAEADLCNVVRDKWVELQLLIVPKSLSVRYRGRCDIVVTLQARGIDCDSNLLRIKVAWDGHWSDDMTEMSGHMVVRDVAVSGGG